MVSQQVLLVNRSHCHLARIVTVIAVHGDQGWVIKDLNMENVENFVDLASTAYVRQIVSFPIPLNTPFCYGKRPKTLSLAALWRKGRDDCDTKKR